MVMLSHAKTHRREAASRREDAKAEFSALALSSNFEVMRVEISHKT